MKILILSLTLSTSVLSDALNNFNSLLNLPAGLEIGKTLITDLDPMSISRDGSVFFAKGYDAHFNQLGFLEKLVFDKTKDHLIPSSWDLVWNAGIEEVTTAISKFGTIEVSNQNVSKSHFVNSFDEVVLTTTDHVYRFQVIDWKVSSGNVDGLTSIVITSTK